jgi:hypothetical protein
VAEVQEAEILGCRVSTTPLPFKQSQPLLPAIAEILSIATREIAPVLASGKVNLKADVLDPAVAMAVLPSLGALAAHLDGKLDRLAQKILMTTRVAMESPSGALEWYDLVKSSDWEYVFDTRPELYIPTTLFAGRVTFGRFFPARGRSATAATPSR